MKFWKHLKTINHHKMLVMKGCFRVGLYKQGLLHDLSKYMPSEFLVGCKYYQGDVSPNNAERKDKDILPHGFITKGEISTTWNTGLIMVCRRSRR